MTKKILIISGSPKKDGNTETLIRWFTEGAALNGTAIEVIRAAFLKYKAPGCTSCRQCQKSSKFQCVIDDDIPKVLDKVLTADIIVLATPLYFFGPSAQIKVILDRMFSLYKWDNDAGTMATPLKDKPLALIASAYEDVGLDALETPFRLTADYTGMPFLSLLVPDAGVSGQLKENGKVRKKAVTFGRKVSSLLK